MEGNQRETPFLLGKRLARPPSPIRTGHRDGTPGPLESREGGGEGTSPQDLDSRGEHRVGEEMRGTGELQVKILRENAVLPVRGSVGAAGYDLCAAGSCVIPSRGKGTVETGLAVALPVGTYARIAPRSGLAIRNFIDVGVGVVDSDYRGEIKVVLFNHSAEDFKVQAGDRIAQLILERIETPQVKKVATLDDTDRGAGGFGSTGLKPFVQSSQSKR